LREEDLSYAVIAQGDEARKEGLLLVFVAAALIGRGWDYFTLQSYLFYANILQNQPS
jgi:high-affinity Fe2+/Pb2+ permease